jgi:hypothetical protein
VEEVIDYGNKDLGGAPEYRVFKFKALKEGKLEI